MLEPAIVVVAYNREKPLLRLLKSLANASYPSKNVTLHISIDYSPLANELEEAVKNFDWEHGKKIVEVKSENQGLLKHVLTCGELVKVYGSIIMLEDDLIVAPGFYHYARKANDFYSKDEKVAGVSLFKYRVEENNFFPFHPIQDDADVHFIQVASSWGQSWTCAQWSKFKTWLIENPKGNDGCLPDYIVKWGSKSWKRLFITYMINNDLYFVFPNASYSSNFEEEGTHASQTGLFQVPLNLSVSDPRLKTWKDSNSIYDVYFELIPLAFKRLLPEFKAIDLELDLFGEKPLDHLNSEFLLSTRRGKSPLRSYGAQMKPLIQNVLFELEGTEIGLYRKEDLLPTETNRFLALEASTVVMDQCVRVRRQLVQQVTVVIPVIEGMLIELKETFQALESNRFFNCTFLVVCTDAIREEVGDIVEHAPVSIQVVSSVTTNLNELLCLGFASTRTEYCGWMQAGMTIDPVNLEKVARVFQEMAQVQILHGIEERFTEQNYLKLNTSKYRWTPRTANIKKMEVASVRTEFVFWRKSLLPHEKISDLNSANIFVELLKLNPVYVLAINIGSFNGKNTLSIATKEEVAESLMALDYQPKKGVRSILRPIFRSWFCSNIPIFRFFYREMEQLPMVIRYEIKNDSYFLDNY